MKRFPIRFQLTLWYFAMFAAAAILLSFSSWWMLQHTLKTTEYNELQERAEDVQLLLQQAAPNETLPMLEERFEGIYKVKDDGKYLQIMDQDGRWLYRSKRMVDAKLAFPLPLPNHLPADGLLSVVHQDARYVRLLSYPIVVNGRAYTVQAGLSLRRYSLLLTDFGTHLLLLTPAVLLLAAIGGHLMSRKALAPVAAIATEARRINDRNLDVRLPVSATGDELSHLSETLNQMLGRIESGVRSIREFTANAAHELRTPLALIRTEVEVALSLPRSSGEYRESCEQVQIEAVRMTGLIDSLLMLARVDAGTESVRFEPIDAAKLIQQTGRKWKTAMQQSMLTFRAESPDLPVFLMGDPHSMQRLLTILLDNAMRYTPPGGSVTLGVTEKEGIITIAVRDTGIGISAEHLPRIFDRFYRIERTHEGKSGGSGLGLALARWIAEKHGSTIVVESSEGRGTEFRFSMPILSVGAQGQKPLHSAIPTDVSKA